MTEGLTPSTPELATMERFVQVVTAGGLALVAGLWTLSLAEPTTLQVAGLAVALAGAAAVLAGISMELDVRD